jgi:chromosome segregation ATPase
MGIPNIAGGISQLKSEISGLKEKKKEISEAKNNMRNALSELGGKKEQIADALQQMHSRLATLRGVEIPENAPFEAKEKMRKQIEDQKKQIIEQIANMKNALNNIKSQISMIKDRLEMMASGESNIGQAIVARTTLLQNLAGRMASQINNNREQGKLKA